MTPKGKYRKSNIMLFNFNPDINIFFVLHITYHNFMLILGSSIEELDLA